MKTKNNKEEKNSICPKCKSRLILTKFGYFLIYECLNCNYKRIVLSDNILKDAPRIPIDPPRIPIDAPRIPIDPLRRSISKSLDVKKIGNLHINKYYRSKLKNPKKINSSTYLVNKNGKGL